MLTNIKLHLSKLSITGLIKSWSLTFATQMLFSCSGSELFDTIKNIILLRIFPLQNTYSWKMLRKLKWQIPGEPLAVRYNWCQGPVPGRDPAVEKHCFMRCSLYTYTLNTTLLKLSLSCRADPLLLFNPLIPNICTTMQNRSTENVILILI